MAWIFCPWSSVAELSGSSLSKARNHSVQFHILIDCNNPFSGVLEESQIFVHQLQVPHHFNGGEESLSPSSASWWHFKFLFLCWKRLWKRLCPYIVKYYLDFPSAIASRHWAVVLIGFEQFFTLFHQFSLWEWYWLFDPATKGSWLVFTRDFLPPCCTLFFALYENVCGFTLLKLQNSGKSSVF